MPLKLLMQTWLEKHPGMARAGKRLARHWPLLLSLYILVCTIGFSSWAQVDLHRATGNAISWAAAISWESLIYVSWIPFAAAVWAAGLRYGLTFRLLAFVYALLLAYSTVHTLFVLWLGNVFANDASDWAQFWSRLPIDLLVATAVAALDAAVYGHRVSREEKERAEALQRALDNAHREACRLASSQSPAQRLLVSTGVNSVPVDLSAVEWFSSAGNYVVVNWEGKDGLIRETLNSLSQRLDPTIFARTHRSTIVNLAKVRSTASLNSGTWLVVTENGAELTISRTYRDAVLYRLGRYSNGRP